MTLSHGPNVDYSRRRSSSALRWLMVMAVLSSFQGMEARLIGKMTSLTQNLSIPVWRQGGNSMCERIHPDDLPPECTCSEPSPYRLVIACDKTFNSTYFNDTIGMKIDIDPCNVDGSKVSVDVTEADHDIDFPIAGVRAGEAKNIPIPGLSIIVPTVGHVGIDVAILVTGNPDSLTLKIGLNACAQLAQKEICAGAIPGLSSILPWYVLRGTYSFGDVCTANQTTASHMTAEDTEGTMTTVLA